MTVLLKSFKKVKINRLNTILDKKLKRLDETRKKDKYNESILQSVSGIIIRVLYLQILLLLTIGLYDKIGRGKPEQMNESLLHSEKSVRHKLGTKTNYLDDNETYIELLSNRLRKSLKITILFLDYSINRDKSKPFF